LHHRRGGGTETSTDSDRASFTSSAEPFLGENAASWQIAERAQLLDGLHVDERNARARKRRRSRLFPLDQPTKQLVPLIGMVPGEVVKLIRVLL